MPVFSRITAAMGLAFASDIGIACRRWPLRFCCIGGRWCHWRVWTIAKWGGAWSPALTGGAVTWIVFSWMAGELMLTHALWPVHTDACTDIAVLVAGGLLWGGDFTCGC